MTLSGDHILDASLLKPTEEEHGTSPTSEEEAILLGEGIKLPQVSDSLPKWPEIPKFVEPAEWITTPSAVLHPLHPNLAIPLLGRPGNPGRGWKPILIFNLRLSNGADQRNSGSGHGPPEVHNLFWNAPIGAPQELHECHPPQLRVVTNLTWRCWVWWRGTPWSPSLHEGSCHNTLSGRTDQCTHPQQVNQFRTRGGCTTRGICPCPKTKTTVIPWVYLLWEDEDGPPPLEDADWATIIPLGFQLDLTSMGSLEWTVSHYSVTGEVQFQCQTWVIAQRSLQLTLPNPSDQPDSCPQIEELWANMTLSLSNPQVTAQTPKPLDEL